MIALGILLGIGLGAVWVLLINKLEKMADQVEEIAQVMSELDFSWTGPEDSELDKEHK